VAKTLDVYFAVEV